MSSITSTPEHQRPKAPQEFQVNDEVELTKEPQDGYSYLHDIKKGEVGYIDTIETSPIDPNLKYYYVVFPKKNNAYSPCAADEIKLTERQSASESAPPELTNQTKDEATIL